MCLSISGNTHGVKGWLLFGVDVFNAKQSKTFILPYFKNKTVVKVLRVVQA